MVEAFEGKSGKRVDFYLMEEDFFFFLKINNGI